MTKCGKKLVGVDEKQLREQLRTECDPKTIKRPVVALEYTSGLLPAKVQHKYGWHEQTVYDWLEIFVKLPIHAFRVHSVGHIDSSSARIV
jgi:hypothetical protein